MTNAIKSFLSDLSVDVAICREIADKKARLSNGSIWTNSEFTKALSDYRLAVTRLESAQYLVNEVNRVAK